MPRFLDIVFFMTMVLACFGVDFVIMKFDRNVSDLTVSAYIDKRKADLRDLITPPKLLDVLPVAADTWQVQTGNLDQMLGFIVANGAQNANEATLIKTIANIHKSRQAESDSALLSISRAGVALNMAFFLQPDYKDQAIFAAAPLTEGEMTFATFLQAPQDETAAFATVGAFAFYELPINTLLNDPDLRLMRARLGERLVIYATTNSKQDNALRQALGQLDLAGLGRLVPELLPGTAEEAPASWTIQLKPPADAPASPNASASASPASAEAAQAGDAPPAPAAQPASTGVVSVLSQGLAPLPQPTAIPAQPDGQESNRHLPPNPEPGDATVEKVKSQPCVRRAGVLVCSEE